MNESLKEPTIKSHLFMNQTTQVVLQIDRYIDIIN